MQKKANTSALAANGGKTASAAAGNMPKGLVEGISTKADGTGARGKAKIDMFEDHIVSASMTSEFAARMETWEAVGGFYREMAEALGRAPVRDDFAALGLLTVVYAYGGMERLAKEFGGK